MLSHQLLVKHILCRELCSDCFFLSNYVQRSPERYYYRLHVSKYLHFPHIWFPNVGHKPTDLANLCEKYISLGNFFFATFDEKMLDL